MALGTEMVKGCSKIRPDSPAFLENPVGSLHLQNTWSIFGECSWLKRTETYCNQSRFLTVLWRAWNGEGALCMDSSKV